MEKIDKESDGTTLTFSSKSDAEAYFNSSLNEVLTAGYEAISDIAM